MYRMFTPGRMLHLVSVAGRTLCGRSTDAMVTMPYNIWDRLGAEANGNCLRCERHISDAYAAGWSASANENRADLETEEDRYARNHSRTQQDAWDMGWIDYATDETNYGRSTREAWARMTNAERGPIVTPAPAVAPIVVDSTPAGVFAAMMRANANDDTAPQSRLYGLLSDYLRRVLAVQYGQDADAIYESIVSSGEASDDVITDTLAGLATMRAIDAHIASGDRFCGCEHTVHFADHYGPQTDHDHGYGMDQTDDRALVECMWIGEVCAHCAETHYASFVIPASV